MKHPIIVFIFIISLASCQTVFALACGEKPHMTSMPILFNQERIQLTQDYIKKHYGLSPKTIKIIPKIIVLHWTQKTNLKESFDAMNGLMLKEDRSELPDKLNVSAHYLVDRDGTIYQLMPDNWMARHVVGLNYAAIGIENVGGVDRKPDLTEKQVEANALLVCYLMKKYPTIRDVIGHHAYLNFKGSPLWLEKDAEYGAEKVDPGEEFVRQVKRLLEE